MRPRMEGQCCITIRVRNASIRPIVEIAEHPWRTYTGAAIEIEGRHVTKPLGIRRGLLPLRLPCGTSFPYPFSFCMMLFLVLLPAFSLVQTVVSVNQGSSPSGRLTPPIHPAFSQNPKAGRGHTSTQSRA